MKTISTRLFAIALVTAAMLVPPSISAQAPVERALSGMPLREIGPALMGGRIADIAVNPHDASNWFIAVGSGGVWRTRNAGITWTPVFDDERSYSIGVVTIDPHNPDRVWVGTGENVSGRHVGWGSGVYLSRDGGDTWELMGLEGSEHIGRILIDPRDSDVVYVAAEGPLWSSGGERGLYKTTDGGESWAAVLTIDEDTGVTDVEFDPTNPDVLYAAAYQRRRAIWSHLAGGPNSGIYKSTDAGASWREITNGLPGGEVGKIGLAVTPANPELVYATIEAHPGDAGFYRSVDRGESWEHRNGYLSGGTGPHYYQEIEASPHDPETVYQMDVFVHVTRDGGATFDYLETGREKHSDNHALWIDPADGRHMLVGTDAGLYETFDEGLTFRHFPNMPISQFYKVAVSEGEPFYDILGGAQDLGTLHGPARTMNLEGVRNRDWYVPMGADGYGVAFDPSDENILYLMTQQGNLYRYDRRSEEAISIQPQPAPDDPAERWNWDSPVLVSPHDSDRIYFASQRLWRSDDRGDSWTAISGDLTTDTNRYTLPVMGRVQSIDALYDNGAMSKYATATGVTESPLAEGTLYVGTDDGLISVTTDGGASWTRAAALPGVPERHFVNDIEAGQQDPATVFAVVDNHKAGDYRPLVFRSDDHGASWTSISGDLPDGVILWAIQQDHEDPELLFLGAENGMYVSLNGGDSWDRLTGAPTIPFRDLKLQRRDDDVVGATFGRGFYVLDDYGPLREIAAGALARDAALFGVRDAWWYVPNAPMQAAGKPTLGSDDWTGPNPDFGATFTYWLADVAETREEERREAEETASGDIPFPGWEALRAESAESGPMVFLEVRDATGTPVRRLRAPARTGLHRITWDLRRPAPNAVNLTTPDFVPPWAGTPRGPLVAPGEYTVSMVLVHGESVTPLGEPQSFTVKPVPTAPEGTDFLAATEFQDRVAGLIRRLNGAGQEIGRVRNRLRHMRAALVETPEADVALFGRMDALEERLDALNRERSGDPIPARRNESTVPGLQGRVGRVSGIWNTRQEPTETMRSNVRIVEVAIDDFMSRLSELIEVDLAALEADLAEAGAPWTPGRRLGGG